MAQQDGPSAVNFQSEQGDVEFQAETGESAGLAERVTERVTEAAQNVNWNKVAVGAGAVAAVAGAALAAKKFAGRDGEGRSSDSSRKND
jgi:hypothetical protein